MKKKYIVLIVILILIYEGTGGVADAGRYTGFLLTEEIRMPRCTLGGCVQPAWSVLWEAE